MIITNIRMKSSGIMIKTKENTIKLIIMIMREI